MAASSQKVISTSLTDATGEWTTVFPDAAMTLAAVDRLVHHAVILEMNVESYRRHSAVSRQKQHAVSDSKRDTKEKELVSAPTA